MSERFFLKAFALAAVAALLAGPVAAADELGRGTSVDDWKGFTVLKGGKGYVQAPLGQLHYRDIGPRDDKTPIVLLHQSPMSMIQWAEVQNELAGMGPRVITVDTPGNGLSDPPPKQPTIEDFAENLVPLLDDLKLTKVIMGGHHTGAQIATAFTARHQDRVVALVMHGSAMFSDEELAKRQARIGKGAGPGRLPQPNGSHLSRRFNPDKPQSQELMNADTWLTITSFITGPDLGHYAAYFYHMQPDIMKIKVPTLLLSDTGDAVNPIDKQVIDLRPDFQYVEFSNGNFMQFMAEPKRWAAIVDGWTKKTIK